MEVAMKITLSAPAFNFLKNGQKEWEIRSFCGKWNKLKTGPIEIKKSNSMTSIYGKIVEIMGPISIFKFYSLVDYKKVIPEAISIQDALKKNNNFNSHGEIIAIRISIDN